MQNKADLPTSASAQGAARSARLEMTRRAVRTMSIADQYLFTQLKQVGQAHFHSVRERAGDAPSPPSACVLASGLPCVARPFLKPALALTQPELKEQFLAHLELGKCHMHAEAPYAAAKVSTARSRGRIEQPHTNRTAAGGGAQGGAGENRGEDGTDKYAARRRIWRAAMSPERDQSGKASGWAAATCLCVDVQACLHRQRAEGARCSARHPLVLSCSHKYW